MGGHAVGWDNVDIQVEGVGRDIVHDGDQITRHRFDLTEVPGLRYPVDLGNVKHPVLFVAFDANVVGIHRHHPLPSFGAHSR